MLFSLEDISFAYPDSLPLFSRFSAEIPEGFWLVRGPSGCGKSSFFRILCALEAIQEGALLYKGIDCASIAAPLLRKRIAYVQQKPTLVSGTVRENLLLPFSFAANAEMVRPSDDSILKLFAEFHLPKSALQQAAEELSVGQAQRVCLIRTLLLGAETFLMDEPTSALDVESVQVVHDAVQKLVQQGKSVLMISHAETDPPHITGTIKLGPQGITLL